MHSAEPSYTFDKTYPTQTRDVNRGNTWAASRLFAAPR